MCHQKPEIVLEVKVAHSANLRSQASITHTIQHRGLALLVVLWMISIMSMISASLLYSVKIESGLMYYHRDRATQHAYSDAALRYAIQQLLLDKQHREVKNLSKPFSWYFEARQVDFLIIAENGLIDLNQAPRKLLYKLLIQQGLTEEKCNRLLDRIADFKDKDNLSRLNGAEDSDYIEAGFPAGAKDAPFERIEELQQVLGIDASLYKKLKKYLSVNAQSKGINPMLAPRHILLLLADNEEELVDDFMQQRENTEDTMIPFPFGNDFISYTQSDRYRISVKLTQAEQHADFSTEYSIRLMKDKIPPFSSLGQF